MSVKPVLIFTTYVKIFQGSAVQGSEVSRYSYTTHTADGVEQGFPACDIFQQAKNATALGRGSEAKSASQCTLATPILMLQKGGGGGAQLAWRRS